MKNHTFRIQILIPKIALFILLLNPIKSFASPEILLAITNIGFQKIQVSPNFLDSIEKPLEELPLEESGEYQDLFEMVQASPQFNSTALLSLLNILSKESKFLFTSFPGTQVLASGRTLTISILADTLSYTRRFLSYPIALGDFQDPALIRFKLASFLLSELLNFYLKSPQDEFEVAKSTSISLLSDTLGQLWAFQSKDGLQTYRYRSKNRPSKGSYTHSEYHRNLLDAENISILLGQKIGTFRKNEAISKALAYSSVGRDPTLPHPFGLAVQIAQMIFDFESQSRSHEKSNTFLNFLLDSVQTNPDKYWVSLKFKNHLSEKEMKNFSKSAFSLGLLMEEFQNTLDTDQRSYFKNLRAERDLSTKSILKMELQILTHTIATDRGSASDPIFASLILNADKTLSPLAEFVLRGSDFPQKMPDLPNMVTPAEAIWLPSLIHSYQVERNLGDYDHFLSEQFTMDLLKLEADQHWVDMGCGEGLAIENYKTFTTETELAKNSKRQIPMDILKKPLERRAQATGVTLEMKRPVPKDIPGVQFHVGRLFQEIGINEIRPADLISDLHGVIAYSGDLDHVLQRYLNLLKDNGSIYLLLTATQFVKTNDQRVLTLSEWLREIPGINIETGDGSLIKLKIKNRQQIVIPKLSLQFSDAECPPNRFFVETQ